MRMYDSERLEMRNEYYLGGERLAQESSLSKSHDGNGKLIYSMSREESDSLNAYLRRATADIFFYLRKCAFCIRGLRVCGLVEKWNAINLNTVRSGSLWHTDGSAPKLKRVRVDYSEPLGGSRIAVILTAW